MKNHRCMIPSRSTFIHEEPHYLIHKAWQADLDLPSTIVLIQLLKFHLQKGIINKIADKFQVNALRKFL